MDLRVHSTHMLVLALAGCGRTGLLSSFGAADAATGSSADVAMDQRVRVADGHVDIAVVQGSSQDYNGAVLLLVNQGDGTFRAPVTFAITGFPWAFALAEFNGDGFPDLAVTMADHTMSVFLSKCE
jgi:hypothetical protein